MDNINHIKGSIRKEYSANAYLKFRCISIELGDILICYH